MAMKIFIAMAMLAVSLQGAPASAQGVYVTHGQNGPVFSDKPQSGAKEVTLQPLNVMAAPKAAPSSASRASAPAASTLPAPGKADEQRAVAARANYLSLVIVAPENEGSVIANTGMFEVRLASDPPLQLGDGHAYMVSINGRPLGQRFTTTELMIPPEFWGGSVPMNQFAQLDASLVDGSGNVLIRATPVRFFMRYTTVLNNPNIPHPYYPFGVVRPIGPHVPSLPVVPVVPIVPIVPTPQPKPASSNWPMTGQTARKN
jgi:hypothetical protein